VFSRTNIARGNETYRFSATNTLSDIPLLIGEILRRSELRSQRKARPRSPIQKIRAICTRIIRRIRGKSPEVELPGFYSASAREIPHGTYSIPWPTVVQTALKRLSTDSRIWLNVCQYLAFDGDWKPSPLSAGNNIPLGWVHLSVTQKTLALAGAKKFLIEHEPPVAEPGKQTNYSLAGYTAVALLVGQIESAAELASAFRDKWIRAVVQHSPSNGTDSKRALLAICRRLDPAQTLGLLRETILHEATTGQGVISATADVEEIAEEEVQAMLWECATAPNLMTEAICQLVILVTKHGWNWFKIPLNEVANGNTSLRTEQRVAILATVFRLRTVESWDIIWPAMQIDTELGRSIFRELACHHQYSAETGIHRVSESKLIDLYRKLAELYPIEEDPPFRPGPQPTESESQDSLPRRSIAEFRQEIPRILAGRDSQAGCDALALLASEFEQSRSQTKR